MVLLWPPVPVPAPEPLPLVVELVTPADHSQAGRGFADNGRLRLVAPEQAVPAPPSARPPAPPSRPPAQAAKPKPPRPAIPTDAFNTMLRDLGALRAANLGTPAAANGGIGANSETALGRRGLQGLKDFIRAQIERRWEFDVRSLVDTEVVVSLHVVLAEDGSVTKADIVDDPHYAGDPLYRQLARSLRNAARVASPLQLPPGDYAAFRDLTLQFNPRQVLR
ncbi:MAG TPA: hypothetical protein HPQ04_13415 [Rhodospirillaceae bacterium]|nr:hypothetical protein [Rhodospirillaceae bacterium]